jgi:hypothetical protein
MSKTTDDKEQRYTNIILEDMNSKYDTLLEMMGYLKDNMMTKQDGQEIKNDVKQLKSDMHIVKVAVTDTSRQVSDHEARITRLESQTA